MTFDVLKARSRELGSPLRTEPSERRPLTLAAVQCAWHPDPDRHALTISEGVRIAAAESAEVVCLQELTLSPYFAINERLAAGAGERRENIPDGPTTELARELARETGAMICASLYEAPEVDGELGYNTAICVAPDGELLARTRKLHIPEFPGYEENLCFRPGDTGFPVVEAAGARFGFPT